VRILREYACTCGVRFEHTHRPEADVASCPFCGRIATENDEILGGRLHTVTIPSYRGSLKQKAGHVHTHGDRPAEKGSVSVRGPGEIQ
jgi:hypothetical protein